MLTKCTIKMLYGRYGDRLCHPSISPLTTALNLFLMNDLGQTYC